VTEAKRLQLRKNLLELQGSVVHVFRSQILDEIALKLAITLRIADHAGGFLIDEIIKIVHLVH
jgi:hypothetical protein